MEVSWQHVRGPPECDRIMLTHVRKHVFRDLRPYVSTYEGCQNAQNLYVTRHDWLYHEAQLHRRSWICISDCNERFLTPESLKRHILECHSETITASQVPVLLKMCERPADPGKSAICSLCGSEEMDLSKINNHVASHLEELALFVLGVETDDQTAVIFSDYAEKSHGDHNCLSDDDLSSLSAFSDKECIEISPQDSKTFEQGLKLKGEPSLTSVNDWLGVDKDEMQAAPSELHDQVVQLLRKNRVDVNAQGEAFDGAYALWTASSEGHDLVVQMLLDQGIDMNTQNKHGSTALHMASRNGHEKVVQRLINAGADVNARRNNGDTALHVASENGHEEVVRRLINTVTDVNARKNNGDTALQVASRNGHHEIVQILLTAGADVDVQNGLLDNALHTASANGHEKVVRMLINAGANSNVRNNLSETPLWAASKKGHEIVVKLLIDAGAYVNAHYNGYYKNALHAASANGHEEVVRMLINAGANTNMGKSKRTKSF